VIVIKWLFIVFDEENTTIALARGGLIKEKRIIMLEETYYNIALTKDEVLFLGSL
jgi:hypothetical protein